MNTDLEMNRSEQRERSRGHEGTRGRKGLRELRESARMDTKIEPRIFTDESRSPASQLNDRQDACPTLSPRIEINPEAWVGADDGGQRTED